MKKAVALFLAIYMFFGSLFPGNSFFEFSEVSSLLKHFQHHRTIETPGIGFIDFMIMHYANCKHEDSDPVNHSKLPVHHGFTAAINDQVLPSSVLIKTPLIDITESIKLHINNHLLIPLRLSESIFHPPKV